MDPIDKEIHIGHLVRMKVEELQIPVAKFADMINTSRTNVYNIFSRKNIKGEQLELISKVLNFNFLQYVVLENELAKNIPKIKIIIEMNINDNQIADWVKKLYSLLEVKNIEHSGIVIKIENKP